MDRLLKTGHVRVHRGRHSELIDFIRNAKNGKPGRRPVMANIRLVIDAIMKNAGYKDSPELGMSLGVWRTIYNGAVGETDLSKDQVIRVFSALAGIKRHDGNPLIVLKNMALTESEDVKPQGSGNNRKGKRRKTARVGIEVIAYFYRDLLDLEDVKPQGVEDNNRNVLIEESSQKIKKSVPRLSADPVLCTAENRSKPFNVKVKDGLVKDDTDQSFGSSPEPNSRPDRVMQIPTGKTKHAGALVEKQKRAAEHIEQGKPNLTAKRGGITFEEAKEQYPELERGLKYLTYLNNLGVTFYPTHLDKFKTIIGKLKPDPTTLRNPIYDKLQEASKHRLEFDTVKAFTDHIKNPVVAAPITFKMQANELPF